MFFKAIIDNHEFIFFLTKTYGDQKSHYHWGNLVFH